MIIDRYECPVERAEPTVSDPILQEMDGILDDPPNRSGSPRQPALPLVSAGL
jgi:hypothetical protein